MKSFLYAALLFSVFMMINACKKDEFDDSEIQAQLDSLENQNALLQAYLDAVSRALADSEANYNTALDSLRNLIDSLGMELDNLPGIIGPMIQTTTGNRGADSVAFSFETKWGLYYGQQGDFVWYYIYPADDPTYPGWHEVYVDLNRDIAATGYNSYFYFLWNPADGVNESCLGCYLNTDVNFNAPDLNRSIYYTEEGNIGATSVPDNMVVNHISFDRDTNLFSIDFTVSHSEGSTTSSTGNPGSSRYVFSDEIMYVDQK